MQPEDVSSSDVALQTSHESQSVRVRYEMLGAPTLLYRHAPSYFDTSNRPSTLTPYQQKMVEYMKRRPFSHWFLNRQQIQEKNLPSRNPTQALLSNNHIPCLHMAWGRSHDWDSHDAQAKFDAQNIIDDITRTNRARLFSLWPEYYSICERESRAVPSSCLIFMSIFLLKCKQLNPNLTNDFIFEGAVEAWKNMPERKKNVYRKKAYDLNFKISSDCENDTAIIIQHLKPLSEVLDEERLKWLEWKLDRWARREGVRKARKNILNEYYMEREIKRLVNTWTREEKDYLLKNNKRKRCSSRSKTINNQSNKHKIISPSMSTSTDMPPVDVFLSEESHCNDYSSSSSVSSTVTSSSLSSISSISTHHTECSLFHTWEEHAESELAKMKDLDNFAYKELSTCEDSRENEDYSCGSLMKSIEGNISFEDRGDVPSSPSEVDVACSEAEILKKIELPIEDIYNSTDDVAKVTDSGKDITDQTSSVSIIVTANTEPSSAIEELTSYDIRNPKWEKCSRINGTKTHKLIEGTDYFSPFRNEDVEFCLRSDHFDGKCDTSTNNLGKTEIAEEGEGVEFKSNAENDSTTAGAREFEDLDVSFTSQNQHLGVGGPACYGNCLILLKCSCLSCYHVNNGLQHAGSQTEISLPSHFLVHPTGEFLSCLTISNLRLPRDHSLRCNKQSDVIDVGCRILQIAMYNACVNEESLVHLVVRTSQHCSVVIAKSKSTDNSGPSVCSVIYDMSEKIRIDLRSTRNMDHPSCLPVHVTCSSESSIHFFTCSSFAILTQDYIGNESYIHHVKMKGEPQVKRHSFSELSYISLIEYDPRDRNFLWAAARSSTALPLTRGFYKMRGMIAGYGLSLFRINLKDDSSVYMWSPSHEEYILEGVYSINGIMPDAIHDHLLWVSSTSACKVWVLDVRYKSPKAIISWSLPSLCDDIGTVFSVTGLHGAGVLMSQLSSLLVHKTDEKRDVSIMFSMKKDLQSPTLNAYYFPSALPRFQTQALESAGFIDLPGYSFDVTSIARSSTYPMPDTSEGIFIIGLATLQVSSLTALTSIDLSLLGYQTSPAKVAYVLTLTSTGDIFCHTLLACNGSEVSQSRYFSGLPVGTMSIPVPCNALQCSKRHYATIQGQMKIELNNQFPIPYSAISSYSIGHYPSKPLDIGCMKKKVVHKKTGCNKSRDICRNASLETPLSLYELLKSGYKEQLVDKTIDTFIVGSSEESNIDVYTSINQDDLEKRVQIFHSDPRFRIATTKTCVTTSLSESDFNSTTINNDPQSIKVQYKHLLVAYDKLEEMKDEIMLADGCDDKRGDLSISLLRKLKKYYFSDELYKCEIDTMNINSTSSQGDDDDSEDQSVSPVLHSLEDNPFLDNN